MAISTGNQHARYFGDFYDWRATLDQVRSPRLTWLLNMAGVSRLATSTLSVKEQVNLDRYLARNVT
jgi:hypothetical protein